MTDETKPTPEDQQHDDYLAGHCWMNEDEDRAKAHIPEGYEGDYVTCIGKVCDAFAAGCEYQRTSMLPNPDDERTARVWANAEAQRIFASVGALTKPESLAVSLAAAFQAGTEGRTPTPSPQADSVHIDGPMAPTTLEVNCEAQPVFSPTSTHTTGTVGSTPPRRGDLDDAPPGPELPEGAEWDDSQGLLAYATGPGSERAWTVNGERVESRYARPALLVAVLRKAGALPGDGTRGVDALREVIRWLDSESDADLEPETEARWRRVAGEGQ